MIQNGPGELGSGGGHARTALRMFKMDSPRGPAIERTELCSAFCGSLDGSGVWGRMDACMCMAESLPCSLENITTLFVNLLYPHIHKKLKRKPKWPSRDCPGIPVVKTLPSNAGGAGPIPGQGGKSSHVLCPKEM